jgi:hypothetical protein
MRTTRFVSLVLAIVIALQSLGASAQAAWQTDEPTQINPTTPVLIVGSYGVGGEIRAIYPSADATIRTSFEWFADQQKLPQQTSSRLSLTEALVGKVISAKITLRKRDFANLVVNAQGAIVHNGLPVSSGSMGYMGESINMPGCFAPRPSEVETPTLGWNIWFSCNPWNTDYGFPPERKFAWYRNGSLIAGASGQEYELKPIDSGKELWGFFQTTYENGFVFTEAKKLAAPIPYVSKLGTPTISGELSLDSTLTARVSSLDAGTTIGYQWFSDYLPVIGETNKTFKVRNEDLGKAVQVLVSADKVGYTKITALSDPVAGFGVKPLNALDSYLKINRAVPATNNVFDISYVVSPTVTNSMLEREKALLQRAADFWSNDYTPNGVTVVYITKTDATWAENLVAQHPSWGGAIPGGITSWINKANCGFALAFLADSKQVFIECLHDGADRSLQDDSVGAHEYTHWFQYAQNPSIAIYTVPWLVEGQANFFGEAINAVQNDPKLQFINYSLAGYATQWDIYRGYTFADFKELDIFDRANVFENKVMLQRNGLVWDQYLIGTLVSEWLVSKFGNDKFVTWTKTLMTTKGQTRESEIAANAIAFKSSFGFEFADLATWITPYLAARSAQIRGAWNRQMNIPVTQPRPKKDPLQNCLGQ